MLLRNFSGNFVKAVCSIFPDIVLDKSKFQPTGINHLPLFSFPFPCCSFLSFTFSLALLLIPIFTGKKAEKKLLVKLMGS